MPLILTASGGALGLYNDLQPPETVREPAFIIIGLAVGLGFDPAVLRRVAKAAPAAMAAILAIIAVCDALAALLAATTRVSLLGCLPGPHPPAASTPSSSPPSPPGPTPAWSSESKAPGWSSWSLPHPCSSATSSDEQNDAAPAPNPDLLGLGWDGADEGRVRKAEQGMQESGEGNGGGHAGHGGGGDGDGERIGRRPGGPCSGPPSAAANGAHDERGPGREATTRPPRPGIIPNCSRGAAP